MFLTLALSAVLQAGAAPAVSTDTLRSRRDTSSARRDSAIARRTREDSLSAAARDRRRIPLTAELLANAYRDDRARTVISRARAARFEQDTSVRDYEAITRQRMSVSLGFRRLGGERLAFRTENATRVRWQHGVGAHIDVLGARAAVPMARGANISGDLGGMASVPHFPGREGLLFLAGVQKVGDRGEGMFQHPLDEGAEAYYRYQSGDSVTYRFPDGRSVNLREVTVISRQPRYDLIVGSLWFDINSGQLVRGAFRPSAPWDIKAHVEEEDPTDFEDVPLLVRPMIFPMQLDIAAFTVEYGLVDQRWWLPRSQTVEGRVRVGIMRAPFSLQESFRYEEVNAGAQLAPIVMAEGEGERAMEFGIHVGTRADTSTRAAADTSAAVPQKRCPATTDTTTQRSNRYGGSLPVLMRTPCDAEALARSEELPPSIFDPGEELFGTADRDELVRHLTMGLQPEWAPQPPNFYWGLEGGLVRYNRVEALSVGAGADQLLGRGYSARASARLGVGDWQPNGELHVSRSDGRNTYELGVFRRLDVANDWGDPLSLGSSLSALLFGRDEGFYYRTWGAELRGTRGVASPVTWRLFGERHSPAALETHFSLPNAIGRHRFVDNIAAERGTLAGAELRLQPSFGLDPRGARLRTDLRLEGGAADFEYGRGAVDLTLSQGLGRRVEVAITGGAGSSVGTLPIQRQWFLGGPHTIRGHAPGTMNGDSYWMARGELGTAFAVARPVVFYDVGWAGARQDFSQPGQPMSGAGFGVSLLEGLMRFDVSRAIRPSTGWRVDAYLEARF